MLKQSKKDPMRPAPHMTRYVLFAVLPAVGAVVTGCMSASQMDVSVLKNRAVGELLIAEVPKATVHMQLAKDQMRLAEKMAANEQWEQAESMLKRARADAELARLLFQEAVERSATIAAMSRKNQRRELREAQEEKEDRQKERSLP